MKLYDEDGNEVEAFTKEEVDKKVSEIENKLKSVQDELKEKTDAYEDLSKKYDDKKTSYDELRKKYKEDSEKYKEILERDSKFYKDTIEEKIKEIAGGDKEYAEALEKALQREGVGFETTDMKEIDKQLKEAKALASVELSREVNTPVDGGGKAPESSNEEKRFTETTEGKETLEVLNSMLGLPQEDTESNN